jgi:hypothetical protein
MAPIHLQKGAGDQVGYQGRKKCKTSNMLIITDSRRVPISCINPVSGNHNDAHDLVKTVNKMILNIQKSNIRTDALFLNEDAGFDTTEFRSYCYKNNIH